MTFNFSRTIQSVLKISAVMLLIFSMLSCKENKTTTSQNGTSYTSKMTKADKKKYFDASDNVVYEVKYKEDGFKLRTASSQLLWKVKLYDKKIKISDNEENINPYEIKIMDNGEAKLVKNEEKIARTTNTATTLVNDIKEMAADQKIIIISELETKGY